MSIITGNYIIDWIFYLDLDYVIQLNELSDTHNRCVRKKVNALLKVISDINYILKNTNSHIKKGQWCPCSQRRSHQYVISIINSRIFCYCFPSISNCYRSNCQSSSCCVRRRRFIIYCGQYHIGELESSIINGINGKSTQISNED